MLQGLTITESCFLISLKNYLNTYAYIHIYLYIYIYTPTYSMDAEFSQFTLQCTVTHKNTKYTGTSSS